MNKAIYEIRLARPEDAILLPAIEHSAGELFRSHPDLGWIADGDVQSAERHLDLIARGAAWVAIGVDGFPVAFLNGEHLGGCFHIWEMSVHRDHQRQGLGSKLIGHAQEYALAEGCLGLSLTTFRQVDWNDVFYRQHGFKLAEGGQLSDELSQILADEAAAGLPADRRCAMVLPLAERHI
jgi:GNAT superfamily N-acetyltransferase